MNDRDALQARSQDYLATALGALGISTAPILVALSGAQPTVVANWRFVYGLAVILPLCLLRRPARRALSEGGWIPIAAISGIFFAADLVLWHHSIGLIGAGPATVLANTQVIWVGAIGWMFLRERPSAMFWGALPLLGFGMHFLVGGGWNEVPRAGDLQGLWFGVGSGIAYAGMLICLRLARRRAAIPAESALAVQMSLGLLVLTGFGFAEGSLPSSLTTQQHLWLAALGLGVQAGCWILITLGIRRLPGHHGAMLLLIQPVASLFLGWWILGQALHPGRIAGAALVLFGIALPLLWETRRR